MVGGDGRNQIILLSQPLLGRSDPVEVLSDCELLLTEIACCIASRKAVLSASNSYQHEVSCGKREKEQRGGGGVTDLHPSFCCGHLLLNTI
jgi:hypothetical protein